MRGAEIGGAAGDLGQVRMAAVTMFNTPYHERMILQEKQEAMQRVREAKLKQKEELRRQKFAHIGQENRQKKHVDAKKGRIVQDKKIKQQQRDAEEIAKHRQEAELKKKMNEEKNKQREMRVAQREERQAREELRRIAKLREDDKKQIQAQKQALERAAREKQVKQLRERDARARHKRNHDTAEAKREVVYDERDIRVREKHYNQLQKIANDRQDEHDKLAKRRELKERQRHTHAQFCGQTRQQRAEDEQEAVKQEAKREEAEAVREMGRNRKILQQKQAYQDKQLEAQEKKSEVLAYQAAKRKHAFARTVQLAQQKKADWELMEAGREEKRVQKEEAAKDRAVGYVERLRLEKEEGLQRKVEQKQSHKNEMEELRLLRKQRSQEQSMAQLRRDDMLLQKDATRVQAQNQLISEVRAQAVSDKEEREERLLRKAEEKERNSHRKYEARLIEKKRAEVLDNKRQMNWQQKEDHFRHQE